MENKEVMETLAELHGNIALLAAKISELEKKLDAVADGLSEQQYYTGVRKTPGPFDYEGF